MASSEEIRLRIVEAVLPAASRAGLTDPQLIVKTATTLEQYVLRDPKPDTGRRGGKKPHKGGQGKGSTPGGPLE